MILYDCPNGLQVQAARRADAVDWSITHGGGPDVKVHINKKKE